MLHTHHDFDFCPELRELLENREFAGASGKITSGILVSTTNNLLTLRNLHIALRPARTLEIGLCYGGSCLVFTASHRDSGLPPNRQHTAIDPFQTQDWDDVGLRITRQAGLEGFLDFQPLPSRLALPAMLSKGEQFDLVYIDGSHLVEDVFVDLYFVTRLLAPGGIVALDDSADPHVAKVVRFARTNLSNILSPVDLSPYRLDKGRSVKYRLAALLGKTQLTAFRKEARTEREWNAPFVRF